MRCKNYGQVFNKTKPTSEEKFPESVCTRPSTHAYNLTVILGINCMFHSISVSVQWRMEIERLV